VSTFEDWHAIQTLLVRYAEYVDAGRLADAAALFEHAMYHVVRDGRPDPVYAEGAAAVEQFFAITRLYPDGTPRTKHVITNVDIRLDADTASSRCTVTVFQQTDVLPLQPIASGHYVDRFERADGVWRFAERQLRDFLYGDRSQHVLWEVGSAPTDEPSTDGR
jgi:3-phenylpropionate/cinnamic acid dioxygenase small subunit